MPTLEGKIALITGAGSGIGRATSLRFAREGAAVMSTDVDEASAQQTATDITEFGGTAAAMQLDVTDGDAVAAALQKTVGALGGLDIIFNNAGTGRAGWDGVIGVNLTGVYHGLIRGAALLSERGGGSIVNTASIAGLVATTNVQAGEEGPPILPSMAAYQASKHGVVGLTRSFAVAYAPHGVLRERRPPRLGRIPADEGEPRGPSSVPRARHLATSAGPTLPARRDSCGSPSSRERRCVVRNWRRPTRRWWLHSAVVEAPSDFTPTEGS